MQGVDPSVSKSARPAAQAIQSDWPGLEYEPGKHVKHSVLGPAECLPVSARSGFGLEELIDHIRSIVSDRMELSDAPVLTRLRHRAALEEAIDHFDRFSQNAGHDAVLAAEDIRMAVRAIGRITGRVGVEDMLDIVFSDFCIGK